jgi:L-fuconolactonase
VRRIDAHQHFWRLGRGDYGWLTPDLAPIYRDFLPDDLAPLLAASDIAGTILVQAAPSLAETLFLRDLAIAAPFVQGIVGWVDFDAADAAPRIDHLAQDLMLVGLRPMIHDLPDPGWIAQAPIGAAIAAMERHGLVFDALVRPVHLVPLLGFAQRYPGLAIVIDHGGKPEIAAGRLEPWRADIAALGRLRNVACKLSGLVTEAGDGWSVERLAPFVEHLVAVFGPERLVFGSDWPVCTLASSYDEWVAAAGALLAGLAEPDRAKIMGGNAERIYLARRGRRGGM